MKVIVTPKAQRQYTHVPTPEKKKIIRKLKMIQENPLSGKKLEGELDSQRSVRVWPYRILYYINQKQRIIYITSILHRKEVYKN